MHGALRLADLTPCATFQVPNNRGWNRGQTLIGTSSFAVDRAAPGSSDAIVLVSFITTGGVARGATQPPRAGHDRVLSPAGDEQRLLGPRLPEPRVPRALTF